MAQMSGNQSGGQGTRGVHGGAADGAGEHGFESDDGTNNDPSGDAFFFGACGNSQDREHEYEREDEFENE